MKKMLGLMLVAGLAAAANAQTFVNTTPILIPAGAPGATTGIASPYPSTINVSGISYVPTDVTIRLLNGRHTFADDLDIIVVSPNGTSYLMSDVGGSGDIVSTLTFNDAGAALPDSGTAPLGAGPWRPSNFVAENLPAPAPAGPYGLSLLALAGTNPNGAWNLFINDDLGGDSGAFDGGWEITFVPAPGSLALLGLAGLAAGRRRR